jgi:N-methylhydantoinase A
MPDETVELVTLRVTALGVMSKPDLRKEELQDENPSAALLETRKIYLNGEYTKANVYARDKLKAGNKITAPAVIEQLDSTTVLFPGYSAKVDPYRNLYIHKENRE